MTAPLTPRRAVALVARREFLSQVRSRAFLIGLLVTVGLFGGIALLTVFLVKQATSTTLGLTTDTAALRPHLEQAAQVQRVELTLVVVDPADGRAMVGEGELDALLSGEPGGYQVLGRDEVTPTVQALVTAAVGQQALTAVLAGAGVDPAELAARSRVEVSTLEPPDPDRAQRLGLAIVGTILLFMTFTGYGQLVATGVVEEKQSRVVELLLATIKPWQLLAGKIIGLGAVGLLQLVVLGGIGLAGAAAAGLLTVPGAAAGMFVMVIVWYLLGFFLFAALYAAIGSTVSRQEELNAVIAPMIVLIVVPFVLTVNLLPSDPRNGVAAVLSFVPFFSQTVMPARYAMGVAPLWQVVVAAVIALAAIVGVVRVAGRIYRNSVLRTGARVGLLEALRGDARSAS